jgi:hypothetical protein
MGTGDDGGAEALSAGRGVSNPCRCWGIRLQGRGIK